MLFLSSTATIARAFDTLNIERYNINSGLSSDFIRTVYQDTEGYIWLATSNGLNRFDGYKYRIYKPNYEQEKTFNSVNLLTIAEDQQDRLWLGTRPNGINVFNKLTGEVTIIDSRDTTGMAILGNNINHLLCDSLGRVWICTYNGLNMYDPGIDSMFTFTNSEDSENNFSFGTISYAYQDSQGKILIGSWGNGIYIFNEEKQNFARLLLNDKNNLTSNRIVRILEDRDGYLWLGTWEAGIYKTKLHNYKNLEILQHYHANSQEGKKLSSGITYCLFENNDGSIWAGTPYGLNIISKHQTGKPQIRIISAGNEPGNISHNDVFDIYRDRSGIIWIATGGGGLNKINPYRKRVESFTIPKVDEFHETQSIRSFIFEENGKLLIGVNGLGFGEYHLSEGEFIPYTQIERFSDLPTDINAAMCFLNDTKGNLWIGTRYNGLFMINHATKSILQYLNFDPVTGDRSKLIKVLYEDQHGYIWAGTSNGLFKFTASGQDTSYTIYRYLSDEKNPKALLGEYVNAVFEDSDSLLWVGTVGGGLNIAKNIKDHHHPIHFTHLTTRSIQKGAIKSNIIYDIHEDQQNRIWIATGTAGLALYNKDTGIFTHYLNQNGIRESAVYNIIELEGNLWLSTNGGLVRFRERENNEFQVELFNTSDGLLGNFFIDGSFYSSPDGRIFAGGYYGFNIISPADLTRNSYIPPVAVTGIWVANDPVNAYEAMDHGIVLKYNQNNIRIEFSSLSYAQPLKNNYAYKLIGLDEDWHKTDHEGRLINYSHLPPGRYELLLNASNNSDIWAPEPLQLNIRVKPHPVRSWWAIALYIFILIVVLVTIYYFLFNNIRIKQAYEIEKLERKKDENINQFKFRFFTNISHELLTPLSVLSFSVEKLLTRNNSDKEPLLIMDRNVKRILHLISQLLDFRKVESGSMTPLVSPGRFDTFAEQICNNLQPLAEKKNISVILKGNAKDMIWFDHDKMNKILSNLLSNALKYTPENGQIIIFFNLYVNNGGNWLQLEVTDSGKGIETEMFDQVFERFYQVRSVTGKTFGVGIGLALAKSLVEIHRGIIGVENSIDLGAKFTVNIPVSKKFFEAHEILNEELNYQLKNIIIDHDDSLLPVEEEPKINNEQQETILIVEDNSDYRTLLKQHLSNYYNTLEADNGRIGYEICKKMQPNLVITDMMMPVMDGIELCNQIKNNIETSDIQVIMLTARTDEETRYKSYLSNADSYLSKPVDVRTLFTRVVSLLEQRQKIIQRYSLGMMPRTADKGISSLDDKFLEKIMNIIEDKIINTELNVMALSQEVGISSSNLYRKLMRLTGMAPVEFIRYIRLQAAAKMIVSEDVNISEAAYSSGFNDLSYFSKSFKKQFEMTPKQYQKKYRNI